MCLPQGTIIGFIVVNASPEHPAHGVINNNNIIIIIKKYHSYRV